MKYYNCIWLPRGNRLPLKGGRERLGQGMLWRPPGTPQSKLICPRGSHQYRKTWGRTPALPGTLLPVNPPGSRCKQCLHRWLPKHVPAQASLVIVVGSLRLALRAGRKGSPPLPPFCKAEPWNSRTVKWLFPSPLFYETCISLFFPHLSIHVRCWAHAALSVDACTYLVWCVCVCVRGEAVSYSFYISNPTSIGSCWVLMNSANISSLFAFFFFFETFSYLLWY